MAVTIDGRKLQRELGGKYGGAPDKGDHIRFFWEIGGKKYGGVKISHGVKGALPDFVASSIAKKLNVTRAELKEVERCTFGRERLEERLAQKRA